MSANSRGAESSAASRCWYLDVSGRRAGPFAWTVLVELAQAGALGADDRVWRMGLASWCPAAELADLAPLMRQPAPARSFGSSEREVDSADRRVHPLLLAAGIAWIAITVCFYIERWESWPSVLNGVFVARLNTAGPLLLLLVGLSVLPGVWRSTRFDALGGNGPVRGGTRALAGLCALLLLTTTVSTALNSRSLILIATGSDPMSPAQIQLLPGGREVEIRGTLEAGVAARLDEVLQAHPGVRFVHLNSRGGWIDEGVRLARLIHARRLGTYTATGCYSACVLAFASGSPRVLNPDARLGLHSASGRDADPMFVMWNNRIYQQELLRYGVSPSLVGRSTTTPASDLWMPDPPLLLADHIVDRISALGFSPSGESLSAFASRASEFESRYPFLIELQRVEPSRFEQLDRSVRLGLRRGAPAAELNGRVAGAASDIERRRLADVDDASALRLLVELRTAARPFQSSDPAQCVAILGLQSAATPARSAAALAAISPALVLLLDAPTSSRGAASAARHNPLQPVGETLGQTLPVARPDARIIASKLGCDRLLLMYDSAVAASPDTGAAFIRALQGNSGS
jgi:GYF domain 2